MVTKIEYNKIAILEIICSLIYILFIFIIGVVDSKIWFKKIELLIMISL